MSEARLVRLRSHAAWCVVGLAAVIGLIGFSRRAAANGAFPDSDQLLLPKSAPHRVILGTNFGLLVTEDDGANWAWVCEQAIGPCSSLFQLNSTDDTLFAVTAKGLAVLTQGLCGQSVAQGGSFLQGGVVDAFADPSDGAHVLLVANAASDAGMQLSGIYESKDTGQSFGPALLQTDATARFTGVEIARSNPSIEYATRCSLGAQAGTPTILRSTDGGANFTAFDQSPSLGNQCIRLAAVDPVDPQRLFLRAQSGDVDSLVVSEDGGATTRIALSLPPAYHMTAFLLRADGTVLVAGLLANPIGGGACGNLNFTGGVGGVAYVSTDGAHTFAPWANAPHVRALAERGGTLYVAANNFDDGYAIATTTDQGAHWTPILHFNQIGGVLACPSLQGVCATPWSDLQSTLGIGQGSDLSVVMPKPGGSCSCSLASPAAWLGWPAGLLWLGAVWSRRRRLSGRRQ